MVEEERDLTESYRTAERAPQPRGQGLNDLYVRFFRMAERQIAERTGRGVVCFISNYSWLDGLSHTGMRERYLDAFDRVWIDNLHGDRTISERSPDGRTSETVFAIRGYSPGIRIGTAISTLVRKANHSDDQWQVYYRDWNDARASDRRASLLRSTEAEARVEYIVLDPSRKLGYPSKPSTTGSHYVAWPKLPEIFPQYFPGVKTSRDDFVVDVDRERLVKRMGAFFDADIPHARMETISATAMSSTRSFDATKTREYLQKRGFLEDHVVRYCYRPMDVRWIYWEPETKLLDRERAEYFPHVFEGNLWLEARQRDTKEFDRGYVTQVLADNYGSGLSSFFPLYLSPEAPAEDLFSQPQDGDGRPVPNLSDAARAYLARVGLSPHEPEPLFYHTQAVLHAPAYREENAGALRQDWPRVPLPAEREALEAPAALGREVAALLDVEREVEGVTLGVRPELRPIGSPAHVDPDVQLSRTDSHFDVTARWGYAGHVGQTMPGSGTTHERDYTDAERAALPEDCAERLGERAVDVFLNDEAYWRCVPERVWSYTLGGYPVIKKWLSYREKELLGRALTVDEVRHVMHVARRVATLLLLEPALDASYAARPVEFSYRSHSAETPAGAPDSLTK